MTHRRLRIWVWFAALLLLQVRIAFAVCFPTDGSAFEVAAQCCESPGENIAQVDADSHSPAQLWSEHCMRSAAPQAPESAAPAAFAEGWSVERSVITHVRGATEPKIRLFLTGPYPAGPHLIYYLQRLLI
jgi:hypothetical protein